MNKKIFYKHYWTCIKEVLLTTFEDKRLKSYLCLSIIFLILGITSNICIPIILKNAVDSLSGSKEGDIMWILVSYCVIWFISQTSLQLKELITYRIEQRLVSVVNMKVLAHLYNLSQSFFLNQKPGQLMNVMRKAQQSIPSIMLGIFFHALPSSFEFLFVVLLISGLYSFIYGFLLAITLIIFFSYTLFSLKPVFRERQIANEIDQNTEGIIIDWLSNHEAIKTFGRQNLALRICERALKEKENAEIKFITTLSFSRLGQSLILGIGLLSLTCLAGNNILNGKLTIGDFVLFNGYILQFILPMSILGHVTQDIKKALTDIKSIIDILLRESEIKELTFPRTLKKQNADIEFKNVYFSYQDCNILKDVSFKVKHGETVLILGPTGVGKSTFVKLLLRIYDPTEGQILFNKIDLRDLSFNFIYELMGWVPQETYLLHDTIKNNLKFACPYATAKDIEKALEQADLLNFINKLPEGLNTLVGNRGLNLSGGEKQRLSLARLFLKKPKICIFDEATSCLDKKTALLIQENINTFLPDMTKIIITHHDFMINKADQIFTLNKTRKFQNGMIST